MLKYFTITILGLAISSPVYADNLAQPPNKNGDICEVVGDTVEGLRPKLLVLREASNWSFELSFDAQTNLSINGWLKITNRVGSKLELWLSDGKKAPIKDASAIAAMNLPAQTTVSNVWQNVPHRWRARQWLFYFSRAKGTKEGENAAATTFGLRDVFDLSFTNDVTLRVTPLLYRVDRNINGDPNIETARLVEFPPIKLKLLSNGDVQKQ
jgi:hypothetical protein